MKYSYDPLTNTYIIHKTDKGFYYLPYERMYLLSDEMIAQILSNDLGVVVDIAFVQEMRNSPRFP